MSIFAFIGTFIISALSLAIGGLSGLCMWLATLYLAIFLSIQVGRFTPTNINSGRLLVNCYLIISFLGYLVTIDNITNFGTVFGYAVDDSLYFDRVISLSKNYFIDEYGLYERIFGFIALVLDNTVTSPVELTDLLPLNWLLAAIICYLSYFLAYIISKSNVPHWIIYITLLLNYTFIDSMVRFYRDSLLYCFYIIAIIFIFNKKYLKSVLPILVVSLLRGANAFLLILLSIIDCLRRKIRSHVAYIFSIFTLLLISMFSINTIGGLVLNYASEYSRVERYKSAFSGYSLQDRLEHRQMLLTESLSEGSVTSEIYKKGGVVAFFGKSIVSLFFPLTFEPPVSTKISNSKYATRNISTGLHYFVIFNWITILAWVIVFPLMSVGLFRMLVNRDISQTFAIFFFTSLFVVANISGQLRHGVAFIVLIPCLAEHGRLLFLSSLKFRRWIFLAGGFMLFSIAFLNYLKYLK